MRGRQHGTAHPYHPDLDLSDVAPSRPVPRLTGFEGVDRGIGLHLAWILAAEVKAAGLCLPRREALTGADIDCSTRRVVPAVTGR